MRRSRSRSRSGFEAKAKARFMSANAPGFAIVGLLASCPSLGGCSEYLPPEDEMSVGNADDGGALDGGAADGALDSGPPGDGGFDDGAGDDDDDDDDDMGMDGGVDPDGCRNIFMGTNTSYEEIEVPVLRDLPSGFASLGTFQISDGSCSAYNACDDGNISTFTLTLRTDDILWEADQPLGSDGTSFMSWGIEEDGNCNPVFSSDMNPDTGVSFNSYQLWFLLLPGDGPKDDIHADIELQKGVLFTNPESTQVLQITVPSYTAAFNFTYLP